MTKKKYLERNNNQGKKYKKKQLVKVYCVMIRKLQKNMKIYVKDMETTSKMLKMNVKIRMENLMVIDANSITYHDRKTI